MAEVCTNCLGDRKIWLRRVRGNIAHLVMKRVGSNVEFWCGAEGDDADLLLKWRGRDRG